MKPPELGLCLLGPRARPALCAQARRAQARRAPGMLAPLTLALFSLGCGHVSALDQRVQDLSALTQRAREHGAYRCAPEELAQAEAQLEFASHELREGDQPRAREHLILAHANASAALRLSSAPECSAPRSYAPEAGRNEASMITAQRLLRRGSTKEHAAI